MKLILILALLSVIGIARVVLTTDKVHVISLLILLFRLVRNLYYLTLSIFLVDGRDDDAEPVKVQDFIPVTVDVLYGITGTAAGITTKNSMKKRWRFKGSIAFFIRMSMEKPV